MAASTGWLSSREAAKHCGIHYDTFTKWVREEGLRHDGLVGKRKRWSRERLDAYLRMRAVREVH